MNNVNYAMLCDFYELTMGNGYFNSGLINKISYFDLFFRRIPDGGGFAIACGLEQVIDYINDLHFSDEDIKFLRDKKMFSEDFLEYLKTFKFTGDIFAVPEGTVVFPNEPIITVRAPAIEAQLIETFLLLTINHQTLIATKANRIVRAADRKWCRSSVQGVLMALTQQFMAQEQQVSADAQLLPVQLLIRYSVFLQPERWRIRGYKCLMMNTRLLKPIVNVIPIQ